MPKEDYYPHCSIMLYVNNNDSVSYWSVHHDSLIFEIISTFCEKSIERLNIHVT